MRVIQSNTSIITLNMNKLDFSGSEKEMQFENIEKEILRK